MGGAGLCLPPGDTRNGGHKNASFFQDERKTAGGFGQEKEQGSAEGLTVTPRLGHQVLVTEAEPFLGAGVHGGTSSGGQG